MVIMVMAMEETEIGEVADLILHTVLVDIILPLIKAVEVEADICRMVMLALMELSYSVTQIHIRIYKKYIKVMFVMGKRQEQLLHHHLLHQDQDLNATNLPQVRAE
jgi:hypothetical protein